MKDKKELYIAARDAFCKAFPDDETRDIELKKITSQYWPEIAKVPENERPFAAALAWHKRQTKSV